MKKQLLLILITLFIANEAISQFTLGGEFRPRTEYKHGYKALAGDDTQFTLATNQRTRLNLDYKTEGYRFFVSLQDVRNWGDTKQLVTNDGFKTGFHQAFAEVYLNDNFTLKAGRQEIIYDDHRIFGSVGWAPQARSHDAAIFRYKSNDFKADLGLAFNLYAGVPGYKAFQYLWLHQNFGKFSASLLALNNGLEDTADPTKVNYSQTIGTRSGFKAGNFAAFINAYYQGGKTAGGTTINAHLLGVDLGYKVSSNFKLGVGFEQQSGNDEGAAANDEQNAFTPFYGTNHKFNGHMDYFYVGNHIGSVGLNDMHVKFGYKLNKLGLNLAVHYFMAAADVVDDAGAVLDAALGTEADFSFAYPIAKGVTLKAGYSQMFGTETMVALKGGSTDAISNWSWMMVSINPVLFSSEKK